MDLSILTDEELDQHRVDVLTEQERRASLVNIPAQIARLADTYEAASGNRADLTAAVAVQEAPMTAQAV